MIWIELAIAGVATGAIFALAGLGLVLTYKATGVFNFAHGAIAVLAAYVFWQLAGESGDGGWGWPVVLAAAVVVLVLGPAIGFVLEAMVFRPLQRGGATTVEQLVATVGAFVSISGIVVALWTFKTRQVPSLFGTTPIKITDDLNVGFDQLMTVVVVAVVCVALWALFRYTHLGTEIRAVVDRRELAELSAVDADRVASLAWMLGTTMSALTGVLLSAEITNLTPYGLTLLVIETFSIAVLARLTSLPLAVASGVLLLGVGSSLLTNIQVFGGDGLIGESFDQIKPNLSVVLLFVALLVYRRLDTAGDDTASPGVGAEAAPPPRRTAIAIALTGAALVALPFFLDLSGFRRAHQMLALMVIFASIVAITGFAGQITLGQAGFAGLGAFASARIANAADLPVVLAMVAGALVAMVAGVLVGYPALRRRGLFLGLVTLGFGLLLSRFVFESPQFAGGVNGLRVTRPSILGVSLSSDMRFYFFELVVVVLALILAHNLHRGRLGRALAAMRDSEPGARSIGIDLRTYKLFIFGVSAFMAGIGGGLLAEQDRAFSFNQFQPIFSLFWFTAVVVVGVRSVFGAVLAAGLFVLLDVVTGTEGISQLVIGLAALTLGLLPGRSLLGLGRWTLDSASTSWDRFQRDLLRDAERRRRARRLRPSPLARRLLARRATSTAPGGEV